MANKKLASKQKKNCKKWSWSGFFVFMTFALFLESAIDMSVYLIRNNMLTGRSVAALLFIGWFAFGAAMAYIFSYFDKKEKTESK